MDAGSPRRLSPHRGGVFGFAASRRSARTDPAWTMNATRIAKASHVLLAVSLLLTGMRAAALAGEPAPATLASQNAQGGAGDGDSYAPQLSGNGRFVAFDSAASNLVPNDV